MKNKIKDPFQFVKDNLPDYEARFEHIRLEFIEKGVKQSIGAAKFEKYWLPQAFTFDHFPEALEEFRQKAFMSGYNANHDEVMTLRNDIWREACEAQKEERVIHYFKVCGHRIIVPQQLEAHLSPNPLKTSKNDI